ncbi:MlaD family protein [Candidatus Methylocalor cossyra]|uniref:Paraquat-inducible protein B n=1 Tax=Candidatus Methylocalor cossyra TaxID=3108543 RepID=A0ABM9NM85_9GAMM
MTQQPARLIGLFVLGAVALAVLLLLTFGGGRYFGRAQSYVAYFEGSVNGLNVGAFVKLKGVPIGRVSDIRIQYDTARNRVLTPVIMQIDLGKIVDVGDRQSRPATLDELIQRGLRARLALHSLVTGQIYVEVNFHPERPIRLLGGGELGMPEIPTIPSGREELEDSLQDTLAELRQLPIKEIADTTLRSLHHLEGLLSAPETRASLARLDRTLEALERLIVHLDAKVTRLTEDLQGTLGDSRVLLRNLNGRLIPVLTGTEQTLAVLRETLLRAQGTLAALEGYGEPDSQLNAALREVSEAARSVRALADYLERHPDALLYGNQDRR